MGFSGRGRRAGRAKCRLQRLHFRRMVQGGMAFTALSKGKTAVRNGAR